MIMQPVDIAMRLLKEEYPPCPNCQGTGKDPNEAGRPEIGIDPGECEPCDGTGEDMFEPVTFDERGFPIEDAEFNDSNWQDTIEASEPMDIAMRLLKAPLTDAPLQPGQANVDEQFTLPGFSDFVNVPPGQAFASSDRQARGIASPMRGFQQRMAEYTGEGYGFHWALPGFEHIAERGEGKGRKYLEEMTSELKEKDDMPIRVIAAQPEALAFWDKMWGEGLVDSVHHTHDPMIHRPPSLHFPGHPNYERHKDVPKPDWLKQSFDIQTGEPMDIAYQLLKDRKSKQAFENKKKYDTKYHSTPKRKEYRRGLAAVRRSRGVMGEGGSDMSHTKDGKLVAEDSSKNRARHFKGKGTLK